MQIDADVRPPATCRVPCCWQHAGGRQWGIHLVGDVVDRGYGSGFFLPACDADNRRRVDANRDVMRLHGGQPRHENSSA